jgi:predicted nucleic acid-binding protein
MRVAFATDFLIQAEGLDNASRAKAVRALLGRIPQLTVFLPVQALAELFAALVGQGRRTSEQAQEAVVSWRNAYALIETSRGVLMSAIQLARTRGLSISDATLVASAGAAECRLLLSAQIEDGLTWNGVTVANPFSETPHPLFAAMLADADRWNAEK